MVKDQAQVIIDSVSNKKYSRLSDWERFVRFINRNILYILDQAGYHFEFYDRAVKIQQEFHALLNSFNIWILPAVRYSMLLDFMKKELNDFELEVRRRHIRYYVDDLSYSGILSRVCPDLVERALTGRYVDESNRVVYLSTVSCLRNARLALAEIREYKYHFHKALEQDRSYDEAVHRYRDLASELMNKFDIPASDVTDRGLLLGGSVTQIEEDILALSLRLLEELLRRPRALIRLGMASRNIRKFISLAERRHASISARITNARKAYNKTFKKGHPIPIDAKALESLDDEESNEFESGTDSEMDTEFESALDNSANSEIEKEPPKKTFEKMPRKLKANGTGTLVLDPETGKIVWKTAD